MNLQELDLPPEELRRLGYRVVDAIVEHWEGLPGKPAAAMAGRKALEAALREPLPTHGTPPDEVLRKALEAVFPYAMYPSHPRFFAWVPGPSNPVGILGDMLAAGFGAYSSLWIEGSANAMVELVSIDWLRRMMGMPESAGGTFTSGGSIANLTGLAAARHHMLGETFEKGVVYFSDQTHSSVARALRVLGFRRDQQVKIQSDFHFRLPLDELRRRVAEDRRMGRRAFCVVANAGTTNTGAIDSLAELVEFCRREGLWLHVDGAYGAAAAITPQGARLMDGLGEVDSLAIDPHKWLFQPLEIGCILVRASAQLRDAFRLVPEYLEDTERSEAEVNLSEYGLQLTRGFRALKFWMSLKVFGLDAFRRAVEHGLRLAVQAQVALESRPGWKIVTPAQLGVVTFQFTGQEDQAPFGPDFHRQVVDAVIREGSMMITSTVLRGETVLRICTINPRTSQQDITESIWRLDQIARSLLI